MIASGVKIPPDEEGPSSICHILSIVYILTNWGAQNFNKQESLIEEAYFDIERCLKLKHLTNWLSQKG
jgi:hypothetical protein